jgi:protein-S-isoprenylcysteine O-methyltransferase Ste14
MRESFPNEAGGQGYRLARSLFGLEKDLEMADRTTLSDANEKPSLDRSGKKRIVVVLLYFVFSGAVLFVSAGTFDWPEAWILLGGGVIVAFVMVYFIIRKNPEVINERGRKSANTKGWDKVLGAFMVPLVMGYMVVAGLDVRFGWSDVPLWTKWVALIPLAVGTVIPYLTMLANPFLATTVRIQEERGHKVATEGPYRYVRHPMYVGVILSWLASPIFLGSWWAVIPNALACAFLVVRTFLEDRTLHKELDGYVEYARNVRYRLVPGVW